MADPMRVRAATERTIAAFVLALALVPGRAGATVYEVGHDGTVRVETSGKGAPTDLAGQEAALPAPDVPAEAITTVAAPNVPVDLREAVVAASIRNDLSPRLLAALTRQESAWRASAVSPKGAVGLTQLMPATARALAVDPRDPSANLEGGARYLRRLLDMFDGNLERALAAYNAGPGRVARAAGIPAIRETRAYVTTIVDRLGTTAAREGGE